MEKFRNRDLLFRLDVPLYCVVNATVALPDPLAGTMAELATVPWSLLVTVQAQLGSEATTENVVVSASRGRVKAFGFSAYEHPPAAA